MATKVLIFDIGGTIFDWSSAILNALERIAGPPLDNRAFTLGCRSGFLELTGAVVRGEKPWMTADQILAATVDVEWKKTGLTELPPPDRFELAQAWRRMPAWDGARDAIASLRKRYVVVPLTLLSWPMAVGSSRMNNIDWDSVLSCDVLGVYKPDPRCYSRAAEIVGCAPGEIMMVASHPSDLRAAIRAGYRSAYIVPRLEDPGDDYEDNGFAKEFDVVANDFDDLVQRLC
jgi:2-haloacid dehalogenase